MSEASAKTLRDEVLYQQIKDARGLYRGLTVVYALVALAAVVMGIICPFVGKTEGLLGLVGFMVGAGGAAYLSWCQYKDYADALEEIGPDPAGVDTCRTYSRQTAETIALARMSAKELRQQWIGYGLIALTLLAFGGLLLAFYLMDSQSGELLFLGVGGAMLAGGALMTYLTVKAFHGWLVVRRLPKD